MPDASRAALALVDEAALRTVLTRWLGPGDALEVDLLAGGASNLTYRVRVDGRPYVLRRRPMGVSAPKAHDMGREYRVLDALGGRNLPVPTVYGYDESDDVVGAPFYVMDFIDGVVIHEVAAAGVLDAEQAEAASLSLVKTLSALHRIAADDLAIEKFGRPEGFVSRRIDGWLAQWNSVEHRDFPEVERLGKILKENLPEQRYSGLVHGDYRLGNVIIDPAQGCRVVAVVDWEMSTLGDQLTDLAHLLVYWEPTRGRVTHPAQLISAAPGFPNGSRLVELYEKESGRTVSDLPYYLAFEHWRAAIIKDAIYLRRRSGAMGAAGDVEAFGATIDAHLQEASEILRSTGLAA